jgi:competence protein ComFC
MEKLLNLIFIPECLFCRQEGSFFCQKCLSSCLHSKQQFVEVPNVGIKFIFVYEYERFIRDCIRKAKYNNKQFAALKKLSEYVADEIGPKINKLTDGKDALIMPIPVSKAKLVYRGFNQAELITKKFAERLKISQKNNVLVRSKNTTSQYTNDKRQRFTNLKNAFQVAGLKDIKDKTIILVDDVCTTGATFLEAAKTLLKSGAKQVICVALARKS